jgi:squalene synthase HpnC
MQSPFLKELSRFGPHAEYPPFSVSAARAYCSRLARSHYENFSVATALLPRPLLKHFHAVYGYCRWADDLGDETGGGDEATRLLAWWRDELERCYDGEPRHPVMIALRETIRTFGIPPEPFLNLLTAFNQDQVIKRYETYEQVLGYCRNSADPVGRLVLYLCEAFSPENARLSDYVCTGLQLANFWQDVSRDMDIGRVYIPMEDCRRFGYAEVDLRQKKYTPQFKELLRFEVDRTRDLFYRGMPLIERVPPEVRPDIELFSRFGLAVLRRIERCQYNVLAARPVIPKWQKLALVGGMLIKKAAGLF